MDREDGPCIEIMVHIERGWSMYGYDIHFRKWLLCFFFFNESMIFLSSRLLSYIHPEVLNNVLTVVETQCKTVPLIMICINSQGTISYRYISLHYTNLILLKSSHTFQLISVHEVITINDILDGSCNGSYLAPMCW